MRSFATIFVLASAALAVYWFMVRPVLAQRERFRALFETLDHVEATKLFKFQMFFKGFKNKLWAWFLIITPLVTTVLQMIGSIDSTMVVPFLPEKYQAMVPLAFTIIGIVNLQLRNYTNTKEGEPIPTESPTVIEVPTVAGKADVAIVASGTEVVAVADTVKAPEAAAAKVTEPVKVAEVMQAAQDGMAVVVKAKEAA